MDNCWKHIFYLTSEYRDGRIKRYTRRGTPAPLSRGAVSPMTEWWPTYKRTRRAARRCVRDQGHGRAQHDEFVRDDSVQQCARRARAGGRRTRRLYWPPAKAETAKGTGYLIISQFVSYVLSRYAFASAPTHVQLGDFVTTRRNDTTAASFIDSRYLVAINMRFTVCCRHGCERPLSLFYSYASADGVEERLLVPRPRSHARLRRNATMSHAFSCGQPAFIDFIRRYHVKKPN
ncbi:hypothetical protein EVAR_45100_1 [Eumeta japonica]|uniref:Uncharacterized protein n=1 Tax=Eumeta variegata TaxID=151549 RepID=A0A4C1YEG7_EUMVA|nr:hypothetical protein EVAR_45100_1 [Eumeta japonica]